MDSLWPAVHELLDFTLMLLPASPYLLLQASAFNTFSRLHSETLES